MFRRIIGLRSRAKHIILRAFAVIMAPALAVVLLAAQPAAAEQRCTGEVASNVCLTIESAGSGIYRVTIGIDFHMSKQEADGIINATNGAPYSASVFADDTTGWLFSVPVVGIGSSDLSGLSADFVITVPRVWLDEDFGTSVDEVFGRIKLNDTRMGLIRTFNTPQIVQAF
ncbi:hypothetical protein [Nonomuraea sp. NEAU-A123]|uniref:hypothetical protein n=1 Tax=Nonomuraea sp. NEAU-A123 TaxID=2839649 RepID=UPI001BE4D531|nr:hypothetical protein [Nonomuraea sp. NEAU-A123]MBT2229768.1 hypothetical protein [Nonomuraea sp. NEAU-A123]